MEGCWSQPSLRPCCLGDPGGCVSYHRAPTPMRVTRLSVATAWASHVE